MPSWPWHDWDRSARSWAIVLGCLAVAFIWSFGVWPAWQWGAVPFWAIAVAIVFFWATGRPHRWGRAAFDNGPGARTGPAGTGWWGAQTAPSPSAGPPAPSSAGPAGEPATGSPAGTTTDQGNETGDVPPATASPTASWDYDFTVPLAEPHLGSPLLPPPSAPTSSLACAARQMLRGVRSLAATLAALFTALVLAAVITVIAVTLASGSSFRGGVGQHNAVPLTLADVHPQYHLAVGDLDVDLSNVRFPPTAHTKVVITVGVGQLVVNVPEGTTVSVRANAGMGNVEVFNQSGSSVNTSAGPNPRSPAKQPQLTIVAHVGLGNIDISRG